MSLCKHCISGVRHEGIPSGKDETINGVACYVATPTVDYPKDKALFFLSDALGIDFINNKLLVDDFALNGFKVIAPYIFEGDPVPLSALDDPKSSTFDFKPWVEKHSPAITQALVEKVITELKAQGVTKFATIGYCYGARLCFNFAFAGETTATVINHPSLLENPSDLEKYAKTNVPLLINSCDVDPVFPAEFQAKADEILGGGKFVPGYERVHWKGCTHGFAVKGDLSDPNVKAGKEGAFKAAVEFFIAHL